MAEETPKPTTPRKKFTPAQRAVAQQRYREQNLGRQRERKALANSIGRIPKCKSPARRRNAEKSLRAWIETYLISLFSHPKTGEHFPWSNTMVSAMDLSEQSVVFGRREAIALARGGFKTGLAEATAMFSTAKGIRQWPCITAATDDKGGNILLDIKTTLSTNQMLLEDYPEICYPVRCLENQSNRATRQTYRFGKREYPTRVEWTADRVVLADISGSRSRQAIFTAIGLTASALRGQRKAVGDGTIRRPDYLIFDDCETDESARSVLQTAERLSLIGSALQMGGPGISMAALYLGTVIREGCVCDRLMETAGWDAIRRPTMVHFPLHSPETPPDVKHLNLWGEDYADALKLKPVETAQKKANEIYLAHQPKAECLPILDQPRPCETCELRDTCMDAGAIIDWKYRKEPWEISPIQSAMNKYFLEPTEFWAEFQQSPRKTKSQGFKVSPADIIHRTNNFPRGAVPPSSIAVVVGIDVQKDLLFYTIGAFEPDFTGAIIDHGTWPDQGHKMFSKQNPPHPARLDYRGSNLDDDGIIQANITSLLVHLKNREFPVAGGNIAPVRIKKALVDGRGPWGPRIAFGAVRRAEWSAAEVCMGVGDKPGDKPLSLYEKDRENAAGGKWWINDDCDLFRMPVKGTREAPFLSIMTNSWKTYGHRALSLLPGTRGSIMLFGSSRDAYVHEPWAQHVGGSEFPKELPPDKWGRIITQWLATLGDPDNDWLDTFVYMLAAAATTGDVRRPTASAKVEDKKQRRIIRASPARSGYDPAYS
jgi:hypothetical protein